jgi:hypothetical protein
MNKEDDSIQARESRADGAHLMPIYENVFEGVGASNQQLDLPEKGNNQQPGSDSANVRNSRASNAPRSSRESLHSTDQQKFLQPSSVSNNTIIFKGQSLSSHLTQSRSSRQKSKRTISPFHAEE